MAQSKKIARTIKIKSGESIDSALSKVGLQRADPMAMPDWMREAIYHTKPTHTMILLGQQRMLGDPHTGYDLKIICDSTGGIVTIPADLNGKANPRYPRCRFCGFDFTGGKVIDAEQEVDTDTIDAWPAYPNVVNEFMA